MLTTSGLIWTQPSSSIYSESCILCRNNYLRKCLTFCFCRVTTSMRLTLTSKSNSLSYSCRKLWNCLVVMPFYSVQNCMLFKVWMLIHSHKKSLLIHTVKPIVYVIDQKASLRSILLLSIHHRSQVQSVSWSMLIWWWRCAVQVLDLLVLASMFPLSSTELYGGSHTESCAE